jgi:hypothetical protein
MTFGQRDPLSIRYDGAASRFVTRVLAAWDGGRNGRWVETTVSQPSQRVIAWALALGIDPFIVKYTGRGSGIENAHEAAFRRAVYYDLRVYLWDRSGHYGPGGEQLRNPGRVAALEFRWGRRTAAGHECRARAHPVASASRYAARENPYGRV